MLRASFFSKGSHADQAVPAWIPTGQSGISPYSKPSPWLLPTSVAPSRLWLSHMQMLIVRGKTSRPDRTPSKSIQWCLLSFLVAIAVPLAEGAVFDKSAESCRGFVQGFYNWYLPVAHRDYKLPAWVIGLRSKGDDFDAKLVRELEADAAAQSKVTSAIVGIDFDPFLASQDSGPRYVAGKAALRGDTCTVPVDLVGPGGSREKSVLAEATFRDGRWLFVNFHYVGPTLSKHEDLLTILARLRGERQSHRK